MFSEKTQAILDDTTKTGIKIH